VRQAAARECARLPHEGALGYSTRVRWLAAPGGTGRGKAAEGGLLPGAGPAAMGGRESAETGETAGQGVSAFLKIPLAQTFSLW